MMVYKEKVLGSLEQLQTLFERLKKSVIDSSGRQIPPEQLIFEIEQLEKRLEYIINFVELETEE